METKLNNTTPIMEACTEDEIKQLELESDYDLVLKMRYKDFTFYVGCAEGVVSILDFKIINEKERRCSLVMPDAIEFEGKRYTINQMESDVFWNCGIFKKLSLPNYITTIKRNCFEDAEMDELVLPSHLERIEGYAFHSCYMDYIEIPESVTAIEEHMWAEGKVEKMWIRSEETIKNGYAVDKEWDEEEMKHEAEEYIMTMGIDGDYKESEFYEVAQEAINEYFQDYWTIPYETIIYVGKDKHTIDNPDENNDYDPGFMSWYE